MTEDEWADSWKAQIESALLMGPAGPGGAVHVSRGGNVIMSDGFGMASVANKIPFTPSTSCGIRSVTKAITGALVLKANEATLLSILDRPIGDFAVIANNIDRWMHKYVPASNRIVHAPSTRTNKNPVHTKCSLRQLACHNSWIYEIGWYLDLDGVTRWPVYGSLKPVWTPTWDGSDWGGPPYDNLFAQKNLMESIGSVDDIVAMAGAVLQGVDPDVFPILEPLGGSYTDKSGWLEAAICEEVLGNSWYNLIREQFDRMGLSEASHPSQDGNAFFQWDYQTERFHTYFKGHNSNPKEIPGLAVPYALGPANSDGSGVELYLEPEQSQESGYAIGCIVMSSADLAKWGQEIRRDSRSGGYLRQDMIDELFTVQTGAPDTAPRGLKAVNWGFGTAKLESVRTGSGEDLEAWGMIGQGGYAGYGGAVIWLNDADLVLSAVSNKGVSVAVIRDMVEDYAANFL